MNCSALCTRHRVSALFFLATPIFSQPTDSKHSLLVHFYQRRLEGDCRTLSLFYFWVTWICSQISVPLFNAIFTRALEPPSQSGCTGTREFYYEKERIRFTAAIRTPMWMRFNSQCECTLTDNKCNTLCSTQRSRSLIPTRKMTRSRCSVNTRWNRYTENR